MPNQNMQNNNNMNIQFLNFGFLKNDGSSSLNTIQNICAQKLNGDNAQKEISSSLKNKFNGEWVVLVVNSNDNFEFKISDFAPENVAVLKFENKIIYICKYVWKYYYRIIIEIYHQKNTKLKQLLGNNFII